MAVYIGLDIGGTKFMAAAADHSGNILRQIKHPTPVGLREGLDLLIAMVHEVAADDDTIISICASAGGPLDYSSGVVSPLHQPQWRNVPLKAIFEGEFYRTFSVDVDTNAAALAEYYWGGEKAENLLYITLSTGMGGGLVVHGEIYRGAHGIHPEVGHQAVAATGSFAGPIICACGSEGCLEFLVSGNGIRKLYGKPAEELDAAEWQEVASNLGAGLRNMATLYAPDLIAVGGGVAIGGGEPFIEEAGRIMAKGLKLVPVPRIRLSRLGYNTALHGAIALAMSAVDKNGQRDMPLVGQRSAAPAD